MEDEGQMEPYECFAVQAAARALSQVSRIDGFWWALALVGYEATFGPEELHKDIDTKSKK